MLERVSIEARAALPEPDANVVRAALSQSLEYRSGLITDERDPRLLHTARTIRILIADGACRSADALAAAAFVDTVDHFLVPMPPVARLAAIVNAVPHPDADDLLERIVTADIDVGLITVAERLDHARHLHLRDDLDRHSFHAGIRAVYAPGARRFSAQIARRLERWADAFERRLILPL
jgi:(p)ppGpp synthase/HD superfamily hydrolase